LCTVVIMSEGFAGSHSHFPGEIEMKTRKFSMLALVAGTLMVGQLPLAAGETTQFQALDVALQANGVLVGQLTDSQGQPLANVPVSVVTNGKEIARCQTSPTGVFQAADMHGGVVQIVAANNARVCRLWAPGSAPPAAQQGVLMVAGDVVRGQCDAVGCGSCVGGHGGGLLGVMLDRPLVTAGIIGAAVAIPLAVDDDDAPASGPN
jgi:hypothetical protein